MSQRLGFAWVSICAVNAERLLPAASILPVLVQLACGGLQLGQLGWWDAAAVVALLCGLALASSRAIRRDAAGARRRMEDELELGSGLVAAAYVVVAISGPLLFPIVYLLLAFLVSFLPPLTGLALLGVALLFDAVLALGRTSAATSTFATHAVFLVLFAALYHVVLSARLAAARKAEREAVKNRIKEVEERARTFRLVNAGTQQPQPEEGEHEKWLLASVKEIEGALGASLEIAETALRTHTCAAFLLSADDRFLKLYDCRSRSDRVQREKFSAGEGILGGVLKRSFTVRMNASGRLL